MRRFYLAPAIAAAGLVLGSVFVSRAVAQTTQPIQINDVVYGLNRFNAAETTQHIRGNPIPTNGGAKVGSTWAANFIQGIQFDNNDGFRHAYDGNMLGLDFGALASGGGVLYNMETRRTPNSTTPGLAQRIFNIRDYNTAQGTSVLESRISGLSVSPLNNRVAMTGNDAGSTYVVDYSAGATPGTGGGGTITNLRELPNLIAGASNTQGTTWIDNDHFLVVANDGNVKRMTVTNSALSEQNVASLAYPFPGSSAFSSLAYEPTVSPYVYVMASQFNVTTANRLWVLDPSNNFAQVGSFDYSTSMNTAREIAFDSNGNLYVSEFGNTTSVPIGGSIDVIVGANELSNLANNNSHKYYTQDQSGGTLTAFSAQFSGVDVAAAFLDYKTSGITVDFKSKTHPVRYFPGTVANPKDQIRARLEKGWNGGAWTGTVDAINTSVGAGTNNTAIGYAEAADLGVIGGTWGGAAVTGPAICMKYTWYGDSDLNGEVNFDDYVNTDLGFNSGGTYWYQGDYDYNGEVNFDDYVLIDLGFNTQNGVLRRAQAFLSGEDRNRATMTDPALQMVVRHFDQFGDDYATGFLSAVPEPASLGLLVLSGAMALRRRTR